MKKVIAGLALVTAALSVGGPAWAKDHPKPKAHAWGTTTVEGKQIDGLWAATAYASKCGGKVELTLNDHLRVIDVVVIGCDK